MNFEFATAAQIIFGSGTIKQLPTLAAELGRKAFVITGRSPQRSQAIIDSLHQNGIDAQSFPVPEEPNTTLTAFGKRALNV